MPRWLLLTLATAAVASGPVSGAPLLLDDGNLNPALVLPEPPRDDSPAGRAELAALHVIDGTRAADEVARAKADDAVKDVSIFASIFGPGFDFKQFPATQALFQTVRKEEKAAADRAKDHFKRNRPWITDPTLHPCSTADEPQSSYPSGHTTMAYAMASILDQLAPSQAPAIMARAAQYAHGRLACEVHFPGDVVAGQVYGMLVAERLMEQPTFRAQFEAARAEWIKAGLAH